MTNYLKKYLFKITFVFVIALSVVAINFTSVYADTFGKWTPKDKVQLPWSVGYSQLVTINDKIYILSDLLSTDVLEYSPHTDSYVKKASMPVKLANYRAVSVDNKIYVIGGYTIPEKVGNNLLYVYDPNLDTWTQKSRMPGHGHSSAVVALNNKIYVIGGDDERLNSPDPVATPNNKFSIYDPTTDIWTQKPDMPNKFLYHNAVTLNGKIYVLGMHNDRGNINAVTEYNPDSDSWKTIDEPKKNYSGRHLSSVVYNGEIYTFVNDMKGTVFAYNISTSTITEKPNGFARNLYYWGRSIVFDNKIYTFSGGNGRVYLDVYEESSPKNNAILTLNKTTLALEVGQTDKLTATITPESAANQKIIWSSSDPSIASISVDEDCYVTGGKEGTATITAKTEDGKLIATCTVNVKASGDTSNSKNRAILNVTMTNGTINEYDLSMTEVQNFINWYNGRAEGKGKISFAINKNANVRPFKTRTDYLVFDKIFSFQVNEYELNNNEK